MAAHGVGHRGLPRGIGRWVEFFPHDGHGSGLMAERTRVNEKLRLNRVLIRAEAVDASQ